MGSCLTKEEGDGDTVVRRNRANPTKTYPSPPSSSNAVHVKKIFSVFAYLVLSSVRIEKLEKLALRIRVTG